MVNHSHQSEVESEELECSSAELPFGLWEEKWEKKKEQKREQNLQIRGNHTNSITKAHCQRLKCNPSTKRTLIMVFQRTWEILQSAAN